MTVKEKLIDMLVQHGLFESQAEEVLKLALPEIQKVTARGAQEEDEDNYNITFNRPATEYPAVIYGLWFQIMKPITLKWIDENKPNAWCREMFV